MPDGTLHLTVTTVSGDPIKESLDVFLQNQTLHDAPAWRHLELRTPKRLSGLNVAPNGTYRLEIDGLSYQTVSRFVTVPPDGKGSVVVALPVNPKKVLRIVAPPYDGLLPDAQALLARSTKALGGGDQTGTAFYEQLDDLRKAGFLNLVAKANRTRFATLQGPRSVLSYLDQITELRADRFFARVPASLRSETANSVHAGLFHDVSEALHDPPPGFVHDRSFKTLDHYGNLQLSFFRTSDGAQYALDMDIDDAQGFEHVFQVVGNLIGGPTHPYNIHEILIATQELDPGYELIITSDTPPPPPTRTTRPKT